MALDTGFSIRAITHNTCYGWLCLKDPWCYRWTGLKVDTNKITSLLEVWRWRLQGELKLNDSPETLDRLLLLPLLYYRKYNPITVCFHNTDSEIKCSDHSIAKWLRCRSILSLLGWKVCPLLLYSNWAYQRCYIISLARAWTWSTQYRVQSTNH